MTSSPYENPQDPNQQPGPAPYQQPGPDAGSKFGTSPYDPNAVGGPMAEPPKFALLKKLTLISLGVYVLSGIASIFPAMDEDMLREQMTAQGLAVDESTLAAAATMGLVFAVAMLIIPVVLYIVAYLGITKVKNWGRILGAVFGALGTLFTVWGLTGIGTMLDMGAIGVLSLILSIAFIAVNIYWFITAFSKEVGQYFAQGRVA
ncbi:hypothetical protein [Nesterenkonia xinjiangensis]|uniref:Uncharacterized membrane protein (DUF2068 family) n=1 Tax=Nesterenkonia xinjiangensis TaxID=225327 RepID=A0A7Z0K828_9MICC|nr:hypothetical protein [Nesterenkonia xinjiangensis]NYJ77149.1 uncharacterized membrane protein (DUF2068 family) [Nesterenkonia xinjiangensis]